MITPENSGAKQADGQFQKGMSGNPAGKPRGALNHATRAAQLLLDGEANAITRKCIEMALEGDTTAMRLCLDAQLLLDGEANAITRKCIEMALEGDTTAMRLCLERIVPARRDKPVVFDLPALESADDAAAAMAAIAQGVAHGELTPLEARDVAAIVESFVKVRELPPRMP
jgi:Family of unknown function (DUF5681)